jgi:hypothetical protein
MFTQLEDLLFAQTIGLAVVFAPITLAVDALEVYHHERIDGACHCNHGHRDRVSTNESRRFIRFIEKWCHYLQDPCQHEALLMGNGRWRMKEEMTYPGAVSNGQLQAASGGPFPVARVIAG